MLALATVGLAVNSRPGALISPLGPMFRDSGSLGDLSELRGEVPLGFQLHAPIAFALFALWPLTRLVHVFSAPGGYLTRPYIVYRSRGDEDLGSHSPRRGWDRVG